jgi:hypothetical protein
VGLSAATVGLGDPDLAVLVLAAAIDYDLASPDGHRPEIQDVKRLLELLGRVAEEKVPESNEEVQVNLRAR